MEPHPRCLVHQLGYRLGPGINSRRHNSHLSGGGPVPATDLGRRHGLAGIQLDQSLSADDASTPLLIAKFLLGGNHPASPEAVSERLDRNGVFWSDSSHSCLIGTAVGAIPRSCRVARTTVARRSAYRQRNNASNVFYTRFATVFRDDPYLRSTPLKW